MSIFQGYYLPTFFLFDQKIVTKGDPEQVLMFQTFINNDDYKVFPVQGDLAINRHYADKAHRFVLTGWHLGNSNDDNDNTHDLGNNYSINVTKGIFAKSGTEVEIANFRIVHMIYAERKRELSKVKIISLNTKVEVLTNVMQFTFLKMSKDSLLLQKKLKLEMEECCE